MGCQVTGIVRLPGERGKDAALLDGVMPVASRLQAFEPGSQRGQPRNALPDVSEALSDFFVDGVARSLGMIGQLQQLGDVGKGKTQSAGVDDELQTLNIGIRIVTVAIRPPLRLGQQADTLVVADRDRRATGDLRGLANGVAHGVYATSMLYLIVTISLKVEVVIHDIGRL